MSYSYQGYQSLDGEAAASTVNIECSLHSAGTSLVVGAVATIALVAVFSLLAGLMPMVGPIPGRVFAYAQSAGLVVAGSYWALAQSAAMTAGTYSTAAGIGAAAGIGISCVHAS